MDWTANAQKYANIDSTFRGLAIYLTKIIRQGRGVVGEIAICVGVWWIRMPEVAYAAVVDGGNSVLPLMMQEVWQFDLELHIQEPILSHHKVLRAWPQIAG